MNPFTPFFIFCLIVILQYSTRAEEVSADIYQQIQDAAKSKDSIAAIKVLDMLEGSKFHGFHSAGLGPNSNDMDRLDAIDILYAKYRDLPATDDEAELPKALREIMRVKSSGIEGLIRGLASQDPAVRRFSLLLAEETGQWSPALITAIKNVASADAFLLIERGPAPIPLRSTNSEPHLVQAPLRLDAAEALKKRGLEIPVQQELDRSGAVWLAKMLLDTTSLPKNEVRDAIKQLDHKEGLLGKLREAACDEDEKKLIEIARKLVELIRCAEGA
jgi:hypothetical protein